MSSSSEATTRQRALVVGGGAWGQNVIRTLHQMGALAAVCEMSESRRTQLAEVFPGVPVYAGLTDMLAAFPKLPVFVTTPPFTHHALAMAALEDDRDVFVEKPMTVSVEDARSLARHAQARDRIAMVGHLLLYTPAVERLRERLTELGPIRYLHAQRLNLGRVRREENVLWSFACHDIAVMLHLLDEWPEAVSCTGRGFLHPDVEDVSWMQMRFPSGRLASIQVGWLEPERVRKLKVVGEKACAIIDELAAAPLQIVRQTVDLQTLKTEVQSTETPVLDAFEPLARECQHFLDCVRDRTTPRSPATQGVAVVEILQSTTTSLRKGGEWIEVEQQDELHSRICAAR
ncbi:MAG: gfo/Idh/MocA family oxidoreductase [Proteobacteria bacterium]|nr:gfo/Idh/MocA family oxidoreductase [Pseudomonadota bacterium]